ncbi:MAG: hypothetical protein SH868_16915 [Bythopirellula sp.]|nr:hypothetical protein [Bythopirellula sp.]
MRIIYWFFSLILQMQLLYPADLYLVEKESKKEIGQLVSGVEIELHGVKYVVIEKVASRKSIQTPEEVLRKYFECENWIDRIAYVADEERVGKIMAKH